MTRIPSELGGSFLISSFSTASVAEAMRHGIISCRPETSLMTVARMMAGNHVHSIVVEDTVTGEDGGRPWGIVSDIDLARVGAEAENLTAADVCSTDVVTVDHDQTVARAAQLMAEHETSHLIVVDSRQHPVGVISTLDLAGIIAWGRG